MLKIPSLLYANGKVYAIGISATNGSISFFRSFSPRFNALDGSVDRQSHEGDYIIQDGRPL